MKHLLRLSYLGTSYCGFQVQPNGNTIQAELQNAATKLFCTACGITGCSRTDSGVHALEYYAVLEEHGDTEIPEEAVPRAINTYLPRDITVSQSVRVPDDFLIRRFVTGKEYLYLIWNGEYRNPFYTDRSLFYPQRLDHQKIKAAFPYLIGTHDFRAFMASGSEMTDTVRTITDFRLERDGDFVKIYVSADGFLYNMVRILVGTLLEISENRIAVEKLPSIMEDGKREEAGRTAPACGLYLNRVFIHTERSK